MHNVKSDRCHRAFCALRNLLLAVFLGTLFVVPVSAADATAPAGSEVGSIFVLYGVIAGISLLLLVGYCLFEKKKDRKFLLLYGAVFTVNLGYFLLSVSPTLQLALMANRLSYLGAAYSMLLMLLIIADACRVSLSRKVRILLIAVSTAAFLLAAGGGIHTLYYAQVTLTRVHGASVLSKVYGPLHILYPVYLFSYFSLMVGMVVHAFVRRKIQAASHGIFLVAAVLGNIATWLVEQLIRLEFEFLSVSYMVTEILLLVLWSMLRSYGILDGAPAGGQAPVGDGTLPPNLEELYTSFVQRAQSLSAAEKRILNFYIDGYEPADIPDLAYISIHTVKKHNRSIYQKLEIASRDELMLYIDLFRRCGRLDQLMQ